jgi:hypothetical protein
MLRSAPPGQSNDSEHEDAVDCGVHDVYDEDEGVSLCRLRRCSGGELRLGRRVIIVVSSSNNCFLFLSPNFTNGKCCINSIETSDFFPMANS